MWFRKKRQVHEHSAPAHMAPSLWGAPLRKGMWVMHGGEPAILVAAIGPGVAEIHLTDAQGFTVGTREVPMDELRQARWDEIPEPRRPDRERASLLGYR